ncbi:MULTISPECIES: DUF4307 domain-containing protein [unclassified Leifsonia]|uniref:DUF4307 domain-containing protein n=1 Tax=unclassified Leifsonia TaxID=2663824 RepID=UPI0006F7CBE5|nr:MULTISPECIES: DUF4307 domain-containing protein [unclassified Leifsonia]KQX07459.1 hypothetical protein ASC59_06785 [Leifsonia sp. Root1293]KRA11741.1 hypothetical protein ASD61_06785 [Leifsonia sp. Root60]
MTTQLDARYGRTSTRKRRDGWIIGIVAAAFVVVFAAWVIWAGLDGAKPIIEAQDTQHSVIDSRTVSVTFEISMPAGTRASCAVQALNEDFSIVGWKVVDIPAADVYTRSFTEEVRTSRQSNTGLISSCWAT